MMRLLFISCFFLFAGAMVFGQNYYVAIIHGEVYYNNKLLKRRDKIKLKANNTSVLKFSTANDYVKLSGPNGLFTVRPNSQPNQQNEFLVAVKEELFPKIRPIATTANSVTMNLRDCCFFGLQGGYFSFFEKDELDAPPLKKGEKLGFLHETNLGLIYKSGRIKKGKLLLRKTDFSPPKINGQKPTIKHTYIVKVMDSKRFKTAIVGKDSLSQLGDLLYTYKWGVEFNPTSGTSPMPIVEELDHLDKPHFVNKRKMKRDLRFHLKQCKAKDISTFLDDYEYESYIFEEYGVFFGGRLYLLLKEIMTSLE